MLLQISSRQPVVDNIPYRALFPVLNDKRGLPIAEHRMHMIPGSGTVDLFFLRPISNVHIQTFVDQFVSRRGWTLKANSAPAMTPSLAYCTNRNPPALTFGSCIGKDKQVQGSSAVYRNISILNHYPTLWIRPMCICLQPLTHRELIAGHKSQAAYASLLFLGPGLQLSGQSISLPRT